MNIYRIQIQLKYNFLMWRIWIKFEIYIIGMHFLDHHYYKICCQIYAQQ